MSRATATASALALALSLAWAQAARADDYLEERHERDGFMIGLALGPGGVTGNVGDADRQRGGGGSVSLRVGTAAGERLVWMAQVDSVQFLTKSDASVSNVHSTATIAGQYYLREVLWLKAGVGTATLTEKVMDAETGMEKQTELSSGFGLMASGGYDVFRRGSWTIDLESAVGVGLYDSGAVAHIAFRLAANHY